MEVAGNRDCGIGDQPLNIPEVRLGLPHHSWHALIPDIPMLSGIPDPSIVQRTTRLQPYEPELWMKSDSASLRTSWMSALLDRPSRDSVRFTQCLRSVKEFRRACYHESASLDSFSSVSALSSFVSPSS
jgi:hypothetical protein